MEVAISYYNNMVFFLTDMTNKFVNVFSLFNRIFCRARIIDERRLSEQGDPLKDVSLILQHYDIKNSLNGKVLIINEYHFDTMQNLASREGSDNDEVELKKLFKTLGIKDEQIEVLKNKKTHEILNCLESIATKTDHTNNDMFICVILTHGENGRLYSTDSMFPTSSLWQYFNDHDCPSLKGKPKIFIIQACRGNKLDDGVKVQFTDSQDETGDTVDIGSPVINLMEKNAYITETNLNDSSENLNSEDEQMELCKCHSTRRHSEPLCFKPSSARQPRRKSIRHSDTSDASPSENYSYSNVHTDPDILVIYSTADGFYSFRRPHFGSWFIQVLCKVLKENYKKYDLMTLLTISNCHLAIDFTSHISDPRKKEFHQKKQVACFSSTLTKLLYLHPDAAQLNDKS